jgi:hypothetical protein
MIMSQLTQKLDLAISILKRCRLMDNGSVRSARDISSAANNVRLLAGRLVIDRLETMPPYSEPLPALKKVGV